VLDDGKKYSQIVAGCQFKPQYVVVLGAMAWFAGPSVKVSLGVYFIGLKTSSKQVKYGCIYGKYALCARKQGAGHKKNLRRIWPAEA
jgi:hypothetical protein